MRGIRLEAPAKVNLRLRVLAREASGYHQLETVFQALDFSDEVRVWPAGRGVHLDVVGPSPCAPGDNLAYRAADAYLAEAGITQGVRVRLDKRIPAAAGLGGGSSDAGAVLRALNALFEGEMDDGRLARLAASLGADVPFFLSPSPLALAWGRGDRMLPLPPLPSRPVLLALPAVEVPTPDAFAALARWRENRDDRPVGLLDPGLNGDWERAAAVAENDFHEPVFGIAPTLATLHAALAGTGARICLLSGSGGTLFGIYDRAEDRDRARDAMGRAHPSVGWVSTSTRAAMPEPGPADPA